MFSRLATLLPIAALVAVAAAAPNVLEARDRDSNCDTTGQFCCNSDQITDMDTYTMVTVTAVSTSGILTGPGLPPTGVTCDSTTGIGTVNLCPTGQEPVCCPDSSWNGVVNNNCTYIDVPM